MAKATLSQPSVRPRRSTPLLRSVVAVCTLVGLGLVASGPLPIIFSGTRWFLEYYAGVFTLVALSITVMVGLVATDRMVLTIRHRILLQAAHRGTALASMVFLGIHIALKVLEAHASFVDIMVPFVASHRVVIGFGTIAADLMIVIAWTGVIRGRFAGRAHPGIWRALHALAYVSWPFALVHGLEAGRQAKTWVIVSYIACVVFVVLALLVRVFLMLGKRRRAPLATTSGTIRAVGKPVPRSEPARFAPLPPPPMEAPLPPPRMEPALPRMEPAPRRMEPAPPRMEPAPPRRAPAPPRIEPARPRQEPMPVRQETTPLHREPAIPRQEPAIPQREPALPVGSLHVGSPREESSPYDVREPVSRGRLARANLAARAANGASRTAETRPYPGMDLTDSGRLRDRTTEEPVPASPTPWRTQPVADDRTGDSQKPPRLTFLDETPDEIPSAPPQAHPANWDEPDPYHTRVSQTHGRHSGEYQVLQRAGGHPPTWQAALEPAPAHMDYDEADFGHPDSQPYAWAEEPRSAAPTKWRRSRRRHDAIVEVTEAPYDSPVTRKPAAVLTDEEFWAHMRGDALR